MCHFGHLPCIPLIFRKRRDEVCNFLRKRRVKAKLWPSEVGASSGPPERTLKLDATWLDLDLRKFSPTSGFPQLGPPSSGAICYAKTVLFGWVYWWCFFFLTRYNWLQGCYSCWNYIQLCKCILATYSFPFSVLNRNFLDQSALCHWTTTRWKWCCHPPSP